MENNNSALKRKKCYSWSVIVFIHEKFGNWLKQLPTQVTIKSELKIHIWTVFFSFSLLNVDWNIECKKIINMELSSIYKYPKERKTQFKSKLVFAKDWTNSNDLIWL